ncbi:hypothetical protein QYF36_016629 [Acer negundo]|nr:hypothetical protein QYF36_016629 [Acer negundo]
MCRQRREWDGDVKGGVKNVPVLSSSQSSCRQSLSVTFSRCWRSFSRSVVIQPLNPTSQSDRPLSHSLSNLPILSLSVKSADPHPPSPPRPFSTAAAAEILFHHFLKDLTFEFDRVRQSDSVEI